MEYFMQAEFPAWNIFMQGVPLQSSNNPNPVFIRRGINLYPKPLSLSREGA